MDAAIAHRLDTGPGRIVADALREGQVDRDDDLRIPGEDLFERDLGEAAARLSGSDVAGAEERQRLDIDRAAEPGLEERVQYDDLAQDFVPAYAIGTREVLRFDLDPVLAATVTLDPDAEQVVRRRMQERRQSFKEALNDLIRAGAVAPVEVNVRPGWGRTA